MIVSPIYSFLIVFVITLNVLGGEVHYGASGDNSLRAIRKDTVSRAESFYQSGNYDSALYYFSKASEFYYHASDWPTYSKSLTGISKCYRKKGDIVDAGLFLYKADSLYKVKHIEDKFLFADIEYNKSMILFENGAYHESIETINEFIKTWKPLANNKDTVLALFYNALGLNYRTLGDIDMALEYYRTAVDLKKNGEGSNDNELATYYNNVAITYLVKGSYLEAISYSKKAIDIYELSPTTYTVNLAKVYITLGGIYEQMGNYDSALIIFDKAAFIYQSHLGSNYYKLGDVYINIGNIFNLKGEWLKSVEYYNNARLILEVNNIPNKSRFSDIIYTTGLIYYNNQQYQEAKSEFVKCIDISKKFCPSYLPYTYAALANCYVMLNDPDMASQYYSLTIEERIKCSGSHHPDLAFDYLSYSIFLWRTNDSTRCFNYMQKAYDIYVLNYGIRHPSTANVLTYMGDYYSGKGAYSQALDYYQKALIAVSKNFNVEDDFSNPSIHECLSEIQLLKTLKRKAEALYKLYQLYPDSLQVLEAGLKTSQLAVDLIQYLRISYTDPESKIAVTENYRSTLITGLKIAMELYDVTKNVEFLSHAFAFAELSKAAILQETMKDAEAKIVGNVPASYIDKEKEYNHSIYASQQLVSEELLQKNPDSVKIDLWNEKLFELKNERTNFVKELEKKFPLYYDLKYGQNVITLDGLLKNMGPNEAIIEYVVEDLFIYIFACNDEGESAVAVETVDSSFYAQVEEIINDLYTENFDHQSMSEFSEFTGALYDLYTKLLLPVSALLTDKDLIIIPDGKLAYIPFEILLDEAPVSQNDYYKLGYLLKRHAIGYSYSATLLSGERFHRNVAKNRLVAFAPDYNYHTIADKITNRDTTSKDAPVHLKFVQDEVSFIARLYRGDVFKDSDANETLFKSCAGDYSIIHLAMHGFIDEDNPMYSKLIFASDNDSVDDGYLYTYEIYNLTLNATMAVLSACNTFSGHYINGEGIMSIARGFYFAGCPGIIATRWPVYDKSSAEIIKTFYSYLKKGKSKIESLRLAKLAYLESADPLNSHPHFWAGFASIGNPANVPCSGKYRPAVVLTLIILIVGISGISLLRRCGYKVKWKKRRY